RKDIYGRDATMIATLRNVRGKDLENVVAHSQPSYSRPPGSSLPPGVAFASNGGFGGGFSSGPSFFDRLFGGPPTPPAPAGRPAPPAGPGRAPGAAAHPLGPRPLSRRFDDFLLRSAASPGGRGRLTLTIVHPEPSSRHFFATLHGLS